MNASTMNSECPDREARVSRSGIILDRIREYGGELAEIAEAINDNVLRDIATIALAIGADDGGPDGEDAKRACVALTGEDANDSLESLWREFSDLEHYGNVVRRDARHATVVYEEHLDIHGFNEPCEVNEWPRKAIGDVRRSAGDLVDTLETLRPLLMRHLPPAPGHLRPLATPVSLDESVPEAPVAAQSEQRIRSAAPSTSRKVKAAPASAARTSKETAADRRADKRATRGPE